MIARTFHNGIPKEQLSLPIFSQYLVESMDPNHVAMNIDDIPVYV